MTESVKHIDLVTDVCQELRGDIRIEYLLDGHWSAPVDSFLDDTESTYTHTLA